MDQTENQKQQSLSQFIKSQFHRKPTQLLLSFSFLFLLFSHPYWFSLLHSLNFNFNNTFPFQLFSHAIDKNCIFLLCNGLLVFLAKFKDNLSDDQSFNSYEEDVLELEPKPPLLLTEAAMESGVMEESQEENLAVAETNGEKWGLMTIEKEEEEEEEEENNAPFEQDIGESENQEREEKIELEEENRVLSTEEMNKRFDEFIRKMKEELRIEARQQLVMV
ncbi:hypothetical protein DITRI_Ditri01bG0195500 [Diplodiscus trichospermus]